MREKFEKVFFERIDDIEEDAKALGSTITEVCRVAKISRATPDRMRETAPKSIRIIDDMESALAKIAKKNSKK
jgi:hypothetical protein